MFSPWPELASGGYDAVIDAAAAIGDALDPASIARLHAMAPAPVVHGAIDLARARRKARDKFDRPDAIFADPLGVEQSTSADVARHKAARFASLAPPRIVDLCCGIGGDAMALASVAPVLAVDLNPVKAWMARHNARCDAAVADVTKLALDGAVFHIDPDRRGGGRRRWRYEDYLPGPAFIGPLVERAAHGAVKLSPGIEADRLPRGEVEFISRCGALVQAVLWTGDLARGRRTATLIDRAGRTHTLRGEPDRDPPIGEARRYLFAVDPSVERAGLLAALAERIGEPMVHPALGLYTADAPIDDAMLTPFELVERMPWRVERVRDWLRAHDGGIVEIKTRGAAVDPDAAGRELRGEGGTCWTIFALRFGTKVEAWITRRI